MDGSNEAGRVTMRADVLEAMHELRDFMFDRVYLRHDTNGQRERAVRIISQLVDYYGRHPDEIPATYQVDDASDLTKAIDYVSGMTDRYALREHDRLFKPRLFPDD